MEWKFQRQEPQFEQIPVGKHRVRIASAEKAISTNGNDMLVVKLDVSGYNSQMWHNITFLADNPEITNRNLTQLFDSFGIEDGDFNLEGWVGKVGGVMTKEEIYNGKERTKVRYFLNKKQQEELPPWKDMGNGGAAGKPRLQEDPICDEDLPF